MCYHGYELPPPPQWSQNLYKKVHGHCDCFVHLWVGLSKRLPVLATSISQLCAFSLEASAELGEAEISADAEPFGSPQAVTDDCETYRNCLIDGQCKPPSSDRPDTQALHNNLPSLSTHSDTDHNFCRKKKVFAACAYAPLPALFM